MISRLNILLISLCFNLFLSFSALAGSAEETEYDPIIIAIVEKLSEISQLPAGAAVFDALKALEKDAKADLATLRAEKSYRPDAHFALMTLTSNLQVLPETLLAMPTCDSLRGQIEARYRTPIAEQDWPTPPLWQFALSRICTEQDADPGS